MGQWREWLGWWWREWRSVGMGGSIFSPATPNAGSTWIYLDLLRRAVREAGLWVAGYCLMSNHVHLVVIPQAADALARALKQTHGRYAAYWNAAHAFSGHVWQGRFYSCPLDEGHLWQALRYAELNPVRAGLAAEATEWNWSSAAAHCGVGEPDVCLEMETWRRKWTAAKWRKFLEEGETAAEIAALRRSTHTGRPLGGEAFVEELEQQTQRRLAPQKGGRPRKQAVDKKQPRLPFAKRR